MKKLLALCVVVACASCWHREPLAVYRDVSELRFADEALADCVQTVARDRQIADAGHVASLRCNNAEGSQIRSLEGIVQLPNLREVDLAHNDISDVGMLSDLSRLTLVDLSFNALSSLPAQTARHIEYLNLEHNRIESVVWLETWLALETLSVSHNRIEFIDGLASLENLVDLDLSHNYIEDISSLSTLTNLHSLDLSENQIRNTDALAKLTGLERLLISGNQSLDIAALASLTELEELVLDNDGIRDVSALSALTRLQDLSLRGNRIESIMPLLELGNLAHVDLTGNSSLDCGQFRKLIELFGADVVRPATCPGSEPADAASTG